MPATPSNHRRRDLLDRITIDPDICHGNPCVRGLRYLVETPMLRASFDESMIPSDFTLDPHDVSAEIIACIDGQRDARDGQTIVKASPAMP